MYNELFYKLLSQKSNLKIMILKEEFFLFLNPLYSWGYLLAYTRRNLCCNSFLLQGGYNEVEAKEKPNN